MPAHPSQQPQPNTLFSLPALPALGAPTSLTLQRYPAQHQHVSLQAWDAADEYLLNHASELALPENAHIIILNDDFGALTCALSHYAVTWQSDSWVARKGCQTNLSLNQLQDRPVRYLDSLTPLSSSHIPKVDLVLMKLPRSHALLEYQLASLQEIAINTPIVAAGKVKSVQRSVLDVFTRYLGKTTTSLAVKKARLIFSGDQQQTEQQPEGKPAQTVKPLPEPTVWKTESPNFTLFNYANVFSRAQLDIGARLLLDNLPNAGNQSVIDLGCGNGILGLTLLYQALENGTPIKKMIFVDESSMALASAYKNVEANVPKALPHCEFILSNCLEELQKEKVNLVLCNPPFHQQNTITDHVAWQMFNEAKRILHPNGELRVVANRHLQHHDKMKRLFGGFRVVASNKKFSILSSFKK
ncbi:methyltransferase [Alteromonas sp. a30]|uniref:methyltransferase n=1 Tax=Alteromonas sp. a30 TaxID=2730917 RepID=UPI00227F76EE|nr:methyltransferase [Alteromonas sp. a30]MCY7296193.1 methyltransferase [Alteromonas sp. a30]